jgi:hypothetical protein
MILCGVPDVTIAGVCWGVEPPWGFGSTWGVGPLNTTTVQCVHLCHNSSFQEWSFAIYWQINSISEEELEELKNKRGRPEREDRHEGLHHISDQTVHKRLRKMNSIWCGDGHTDRRMDIRCESRHGESRYGESSQQVRPRISASPTNWNPITVNLLLDELPGASYKAL